MIITRIILKYEESHKEVNGITYKLCNRCFEWFEMNEKYFYKNNKNKVDGYYPYCKQCNIQKTKNWRKDNWDAYLDYCREYYKDQYNNNPILHERHKKGEDKRRKEGKLLEWQRNNRDRVKEHNDKRKIKNHEITEEEWIACKSFFDNSCAYCELSYSEHIIQNNQDLHREHVDDNGSNKLDNCVPSCRSCNSSKKKRKMINWFRKQPFFSEKKLEKINVWLTTEYLKYIKIE